MYVDWQKTAIVSVLNNLNQICALSYDLLPELLLSICSIILLCCELILTIGVEIKAIC